MMRFLIMEWSGYMQADLEKSLHRLGIETVEYGYRVSGFEYDPYFYRTFKDILNKEKVDAVMMMNYMVPLAKLCYEFGIPYISWVYDCPFGVGSPEKTLGYPTNHVFFFDRDEAVGYIKKGIDTVYHMPLAIDSDRIDDLLSQEDIKDISKYTADVSFVGQMYDNQFAPFYNRLDKYKKGYIDSVMKVQSELYGVYVLRDALKPVIDDIRTTLSDTDELRDMDDKRLFSWVEHTVAKEITRRERLIILGMASRIAKTALYSPEKEDGLDRVDWRGIVSAYDEAPGVYHHSKINLNITLKDITSGMSLRILEILAAGGFLLTNWQSEIAENFENGKEVVMYESIEDAISKIQYYLSHEDERRDIALNGKKAVQKFSFDNQVKKILEIAGFGSERGY